MSCPVPLPCASQPAVRRDADSAGAGQRRRQLAQMAVAIVALVLALAALGVRAASAATPWEGGSVSSGFARTVITEP